MEHLGGLLLAGVMPALMLTACGTSAPRASFDDVSPDAGGAPIEAGLAAEDAGPSGSFADSGDAGAREPDTDVSVVITADNAYAFGWGDATSIKTFNASPPTTVASDIFSCPIGKGPEAYTIPAKDAPSTAYLYIVTWADHMTTQGVIGQFKRVGGTTVLTGDGAWEACATGVEYVSPDPGPPAAVVNQQIAICNAGTGSHATTSGGWVGSKGAVTPGGVGALAFGEANDDPSGNFPLVCQMDGTGKEGVSKDAHWMWYSPDGSNPFVYAGSGNSTRAFLIFRLPAAALPPPPK
jgi:hypothetical protein